MKHKIIYILTTAVITIAAFFIGKNTAIMQCQELKTKNTNIETMETAFSQIEYIEVNDNGFDFYTFDGNIYKWGGNIMHTYGNNAIVAEYDYYTLDQAEKIIKEKKHKQKQKDREENISAIVATLLAIAICIGFFTYWLLIGY